MRIVAGVILGWIMAWLYDLATPTHFAVEMEFTEELAKALATLDKRQQRERDLTESLTALVRHYKRHTQHRCEILTDAEDVLAGKPLVRIELPDDMRDEV